MREKYALLLLALAISVSVAGCTVSEASDRDQYGNYLSELNSGNADFNAARADYDTAVNAFQAGMYYDAISAMRSASGKYDSAMAHYGQMERNATGPDQQTYADALQRYAQSCMYAASAYTDAYRAYEGGERFRGDSLMTGAADYIRQANACHDEAVELQPMAIV